MCTNTNTQQLHNLSYWDGPKWFMSQPTYTISLWNWEAALFKLCASSCIAILPLQHAKPQTPFNEKLEEYGSVITYCSLNPQTTTATWRRTDFEWGAWKSSRIDKTKQRLAFNLWYHTVSDTKPWNTHHWYSVVMHQLLHGSDAELH